MLYKISSEQYIGLAPDVKNLLYAFGYLVDVSVPCGDGEGADNAGDVELTLIEKEDETGRANACINCNCAFNVVVVYIALLENDDNTVSVHVITSETSVLEY